MKQHKNNFTKKNTDTLLRIAIEKMAKKLNVEIEEDDSYTMAIEKLKEASGLLHYQKFLAEILKAFNEKGFSVRKFPVNKSIDIGDMFALRKLIGLHEGKNLFQNLFLNIEIDPYPVIYDQDENRSVVLLTSAIVGVDEKQDNIVGFLKKRTGKITEIVQKYFGYINNYYTIKEDSFSDGIVFLTYGDNVGIRYDILKDVVHGHWKKLKLPSININSLAKINRDKSLVIVPGEEITNYLLNELNEEYGNDATLIRQKTRKIPVNQKIKKIIKIHKQIAKIINKFDEKDEIAVTPIPVKTPDKVSRLLLEYSLKELNKDFDRTRFLNKDIFDSTFKRMYIPDASDGFYVTIVPKRVILTRFEPDIRNPLDELNEAVKKKFKAQAYFDSPYNGKVYYVPNNTDKIRKVELEVKVADENTKIYGIRRGKIVRIPWSSVGNYIEKSIKAQSKIKK